MTSPHDNILPLKIDSIPKSFNDKTTHTHDTILFSKFDCASKISNDEMIDSHDLFLEAQQCFKIFDIFLSDSISIDRNSYLP